MACPCVTLFVCCPSTRCPWQLPLPQACSLVFISFLSRSVLSYGSWSVSSVIKCNTLKVWFSFFPPPFFFFLGSEMHIISFWNKGCALHLSVLESSGHWGDSQERCRKTYSNGLIRYYAKKSNDVKWLFQKVWNERNEAELISVSCNQCFE